MEKPAESLEKTMVRFFKIFAVLLIVLIIWNAYKDFTKISVAQNGSVEGGAAVALTNENILKIIDLSADRAVQNAIATKQFEIIKTNSSNNSEAKIISSDEGFYIFVPKSSFDEKVKELTIVDKSSEFKIIKTEKTSESPEKSTTSKEVK